MPAIGKSLVTFTTHLVVTAYLLGATAATPLFVSSPYHGRRTIMLAAIGIFIVGSKIAHALAPTIWLSVVDRALQGVGGGVSVADRADHHRRYAPSPRERPMVQSQPRSCS